MKKITTIDELHNKLFDLLIRFHNYCEENNLIYVLTGGSCLGAVRHHDFIPWDDDIDVNMPRHDYERLIELIKTRPIKDADFITCYTEKKEPYPYPYGKIVDTNTIVKELHWKPYYMGIFIDIFPIDGMPEDEKLQKKLFKKILNRQTLVYGSFGRYEKRGTSKFNYILGCIGTFFMHLLYIPTRRYLPRMCDKIARKYNITESSYEGCYFGMYGYKREVFPKGIYFPPSKLPFHGTLLNVIGKYDQYLTQIYGDYMTLPPEDKRITHMLEIYEK